MEQKCAFCAIVNKQMPAKIVYEDEYCVAILDIAPRSKGMTLVIPKQHLKDFSENPELSAKVFSSALTVATMIKEALQPKDVSLSILPSDLEHFHIRIYPVSEGEIPLIENQPRRMNDEELDAVAEKIKSVKIMKKKEEEPSKERTAEQMYWIKRNMQLT